MPRRSRRHSATDDSVPEQTHKLPTPTPTSTFDLSDSVPPPPEEPGVSLEPMELGEQFLRDATEQYNFESALRPEAEQDEVGVPIAQVISEGTLELANQADYVLPVTESLADAPAEVMAEPARSDLDLTSDSILEVSLFDQPATDQEGEDESDEDDLDPTLAAPLRPPAIRSDDPSEVDDARAQEIQRLFDERVKKRLRVERLPKEGQREPSARRQLSTAAELRVKHPILQGIEQCVTLPEGVTGAVAFTAAMCLLLLSITAGQAVRLQHALPRPLRDLLFRCAQEREEEPTPFSASEFLEAVSAELGVSGTRAEGVALAVLRCVRESLPEADQAQIAAHLPRELKQLWIGERAPEA